ncbi:MAG: FkbM family methyltransferase [Alphaproteobacteria bacterium]|nr:FkbM family methyltransferase [Alphaproteobacteria bacterium]OJV12501.1 MAG: hypothetical protein BGO27_07195 [Alphaproteobacteria bacterium 33-17]
MQFIDIGAKDSVYPRFESKIESFEYIHLFEPNPVFAEKLRAKYNSLPNIYVHEIAISNETGQANFNIAKLNAASSLLKPNEDLITELNLKSFRSKGQITVKTSTLDDLHKSGVLKSMPTILKIDAQGMEAKIIEAGSRFITSHVELIICEADFHKRYEGGSSFEEVDRLIKLLGFEFIKFVDEVYFRENPTQIFFADGVYGRKGSVYDFNHILDLLY